MEEMKKSRIVRRGWLWLLGVMMLGVQTSCDDYDTIRRQDPQLEIEEQLSVGPSAMRVEIPLRSTYPWFAEASDSWIELVRYRGQALKEELIVAEIAENPGFEDREGWIEVRLMDQLAQRVVVKQLGRGSLITLSKKMLTFNVKGGEALVEVTTDKEWAPTVSEQDGFTFEKVDDGHLKVTAGENTTGSEIRTVVTLADVEQTTSAELTVVQSSCEHILTINLSEEEKDMIVEKSGKAWQLPLSVNVDYECVPSASWIKVNSAPKFTGDIVQDYDLVVSVDSYNGVEERYGELVIRNTGFTGSESDVSDRILICQRAKSKIVYVKAGVSGGDGTSWERAFSVLEDGLSQTGNYSDTELWVADGEYHLKDWTTFYRGVNFYGGFAGTERKLSERDLTKKSVLVAAPNNAWASVYCYDLDPSKCAKAVVDGFEFVGSQKATDAGGLMVYAGWLIRNCVIRGNEGVKYSGGSYQGSELVNCLIYGNTSTNSPYTLYVDNTTLHNVTIVGNIGKGSGTSVGLYAGSSSVSLYNTVIWGNLFEGGPSTQCALKSAGSTRFINCAVQGGFNFNNAPAATENCIDLSADNDSATGPQFVEPSAGDYSLQIGSPLVDAGNSDAVEQIGLGQDILGYKRILGRSIDIGAYEYQTQE